MKVLMFVPLEVLDVLPPAQALHGGVGAALCASRARLNVGAIKVLEEQSPAAAGRQILPGGGRSYTSPAVGGSQISCGNGASFKYLQGICS